MTQPVYNTGAVGYDEFFGQVTRLYIPARLEAGRLRQGESILAQAHAHFSGSTGGIKNAGASSRTAPHGAYRLAARGGLGANDGILSTASLVLGVAAAMDSQRFAGRRSRRAGCGRDVDGCG